MDDSTDNSKDDSLNFANNYADKIDYLIKHLDNNPLVHDNHKCAMLLRLATHLLKCLAAADTGTEFEDYTNHQAVLIPPTSYDTLQRALALIDDNRCNTFENK